MTELLSDYLSSKRGSSLGACFEIPKVKVGTHLLLYKSAVFIPLLHNPALQFFNGLKVLVTKLVFIFMCTEYSYLYCMVDT